MTQYIYFVKCPDFEDEPFDFFDEAKSYARGCLSSKPVICQVEVCRNDFGECTNSTDLGQVWSWEDEMSDIADDELTFSKEDTLGGAPHAFDLEFEDADISGDSILDSVPDNYKKPIPAEMTITDLVEAMEENEDMVECKECFNLVSKESCAKSDKGYVCHECAGTKLTEEDDSDYDDSDEVTCTWCEEPFDRSECRYEVDLGWLCSRCEMAIKSRGETLTFREGSYWDFLDEQVETKEAKTSVKESEHESDDSESEVLVAELDPQKDLVEDFILCPECGAHTFDRVIESCVNCGFDTKSIMLEDAAEPAADGLSPAALKEINDSVGEAVAELATDIANKVNEKIDEVKTEVTSTVVDGATTSSDAAYKVGKILKQNQQAIYDKVEEVQFALS